METKFRVGDVVKTAPKARASYTVMELYDGRPFKVKDTEFNIVYIDEKNNWKHLQWTLVKPSKRKVFK